MTARALETERLRLRPHRASDFNASFGMWSDPLVTTFIGGIPSTEQQAWARLVTYAGLWAMLGFGYWLVEEKTSDTFVGEVGFADFKRAIVPAMRDVPELGWALAPPFYGKGYATEAVRAAVAWGDAHLDAKRTVCLIDPQNVASLRVAEKCGYAPFERGRFAGRETLFLDRVLRAGRDHA